VTRAGSCPYRRPMSSTRTARSLWPTSTWTTAIAWNLLRSLPRSKRCRKNTEENITQTLRDVYLNAYPSLKLTRDAEGVLVAQFHTNGGPILLSPQPLTAAVAHQWGVLAEIVPNGKALSRAQELARQYLKMPEVTRHNTRVHFMQPSKAGPPPPW
jgi:enoyl-CoA hydratase/carnithine racemase